MDRIVIDTRVRHGKPVIAGTRVEVDVVLGALASGMTFAEVCKEYGIQAQDIRAVLE